MTQLCAVNGTVGRVEIPTLGRVFERAVPQAGFVDYLHYVSTTGEVGVVNARDAAKPVAVGLDLQLGGAADVAIYYNSTVGLVVLTPTIQKPTTYTLMVVDLNALAVVSTSEYASDVAPGGVTIGDACIFLSWPSSVAPSKIVHINIYTAETTEVLSVSSRVNWIALSGSYLLMMNGTATTMYSYAVSGAAQLQYARHVALAYSLGGLAVATDGKVLVQGAIGDATERTVLAILQCDWGNQAGELTESRMTLLSGASTPAWTASRVYVPTADTITFYDVMDLATPHLLGRFDCDSCVSVFASSGEEIFVAQNNGVVTMAVPAIVALPEAAIKIITVPQATKTPEFDKVIDLTAEGKAFASYVITHVNGPLMVPLDRKVMYIVNDTVADAPVLSQYFELPEEPLLMGYADPTHFFMCSHSAYSMGNVADRASPSFLLTSLGQGRVPSNALQMWGGAMYQMWQSPVDTKIKTHAWVVRIDVSGKAVTVLQAPAQVQTMGVADGFLFVSYRDGMFQVYNLSDPFKATFVWERQLTYAMTSISGVNGGLACGVSPAAYHFDTVVVLRPLGASWADGVAEAARYYFPGSWIYLLTIVGNMVYVPTCFRKEIIGIDVSDLHEPKLSFSVLMQTPVIKVVFSKGYGYAQYWDQSNSGVGVEYFAMPPPTDAPATPVPDTSSPPTGAPDTSGPTPVPPTHAPPTDAPATALPTAPPTTVPATDTPRTDAPLTTVPTTSAPDTTAPTPVPVPQTGAPHTSVPLTTAPATSVPATAAPQTLPPPTLPPTEDPSTGSPPTEAPTTDVPTTDVPTTDVPNNTTDAPAAPTPAPSSVPATAVPTTAPDTAPPTAQPTGHPVQGGISSTWDMRLVLTPFNTLAACNGVCGTLYAIGGQSLYTVRVDTQNASLGGSVLLQGECTGLTLTADSAYGVTRCGTSLQVIGFVGGAVLLPSGLSGAVGEDLLAWAQSDTTVFTVVQSARQEATVHRWLLHPSRPMEAAGYLQGIPYWEDAPTALTVAHGVLYLTIGTTLTLVNATSTPPQRITTQTLPEVFSSLQYTDEHMVGITSSSVVILQVNASGTLEETGRVDFSAQKLVVQRNIYAIGAASIAVVAIDAGIPSVAYMLETAAPTVGVVEDRGFIYVATAAGALLQFRDRAGDRSTCKAAGGGGGGGGSGDGPTPLMVMATVFVVLCLLTGVLFLLISYYGKVLQKQEPGSAQKADALIGDTESCEGHTEMVMK